MLAIGLNLAGALIGSQAGRLALVALLCGLAGFYYGFRQGDAGRLALQQKVALATSELQRKEAERSAEITSKSEAEASDFEREMFRRDMLLEAANAKIQDLEKASKCVIPRATVRAINRAQ